MKRSTRVCLHSSGSACIHQAQVEHLCLPMGELLGAGVVFLCTLFVVSHEQPALRVLGRENLHRAAGHQQEISCLQS